MRDSMARSPNIVALLLLVLVLVVGWVTWRTIFEGRDQAGASTLTPIPGAIGFEPRDRPSGPILRSKAGVGVDFGYKVGGTLYAYSLALAFPAGAEQGRATLVVRHDGRDASTETEAVRRWDEPRKAYAVALADKFMISPPVPSLCIKAVIGPSLERYDLADGTLCVAQRDASGTCHPETLACGLLRP